MKEEIDRIIFKAKCINGGRTLGDNEPVKIFELESIENGIKKISQQFDLSDEQQNQIALLMRSINELKSLSGRNFRYKAQGLGNQVEHFLTSIQSKS